MRALIIEAKNAMLASSGIKLTKAQAHYFKDFNLIDAQNYIESMLGRERYVAIARPSKLEYRRPLTLVDRYKRLQNELLDTTNSHAPYFKKDNLNWIGVEIECLIPRNILELESSDCENCHGNGHIDSECNSCGNEHSSTCDDCDGTGTSGCDSDTSHESAVSSWLEKYKIKGLSIKTDGSLRDSDNYIAIELTIVDNIENPKELKKLCEVLNKHKVKVDSKCGLHVHLNCLGIDTNTAIDQAMRLGKSLPLLASMVPKSRRDNQYCKLDVNSPNSSSRYYAINLQSLNKFNTIEVRLHSGTTDFDKIIHWARLLNGIRLSQFKGIISNVNDLTKLDNRVDETTLEYIQNRIDLFSDLETASIPDRFQDTDSNDYSEAI